MNLFIGNLSPETTEDALRQAFAEFGVVLSVKIPIDNATGLPRGFGFVEMEDKFHALDAIDNLDTTYFQGTIISVKESKPKNQGGSNNRQGGGNRGGGFNRGGNNNRQGGGYNRNSSGGGYNSDRGERNFNSDRSYSNNRSSGERNYNNDRSTGGYNRESNYNSGSQGYNNNQNTNDDDKFNRL